MLNDAGYSEGVNFLKVAVLVASLGALAFGSIEYWAVGIVVFGLLAFWTDFSKPTPDQAGSPPQRFRVPYISTITENDSII